MKCTIPEISWHNRDPVLSVDIQPMEKKNAYRVVTGGADSHVFLWYLREEESGIANVEFASDLSRHQKAVNVVRFSPDGELLASGDDESVIIVWKQKTDQDPPEFPLGNMDEENVNKENWIVTKILRGHLEDVYDISWSPTSTHLISGSVDNTAILWDVIKGKNLGILTEHKKFVQGVAWDPKNQYVATMSSDRSLRTYSIQSKKVVSRATKAKLPVDSSHELYDKVVSLFHDDTMKSFFRRICFSPDGQLLIAPSGVFENSESGKKPTSVTHIFTRGCLNKPAVCLPSLQFYSVAVKCCPVLFELKPTEEKPLFKLPYRIVIAVATENNILLYDTQHAVPFAFIANIHYTKLTDVAWSKDGKFLMASSTDGYCSIISFGDKEIGIPYVEPTIEECKENVSSNAHQENQTNSEQKIEDRKVLAEKNIEIKEKVIKSMADENQNAKISEEKNKINEVNNKRSDMISESMDIDVNGDETPGNIEKTISTPSTKTSQINMNKNMSTPNKTPRRVKLITLSSPNRKRKLDEEKIRETSLLDIDHEKNLKENGSELEEKYSTDQIKDEQDTITSSIDDKNKNATKNIEEENDKFVNADKFVLVENSKSEILEADACNVETNSKATLKLDDQDSKIKQPEDDQDSKNEQLESPRNKPLDFDMALENTSDSMINPIFVEDPSESNKADSDFSNLSETLAGSHSKSSVSAIASPSNEKDKKDMHVFTPPRTVRSPKQLTPGRRVQLITLSSPKMKGKNDDK